MRCRVFAAKWRVSVGKAAMIVGLLAGGVTTASAEMPEAYQKAWTAADAQIEANIERYRKGDLALVVVDAQGRPVADASVQVRLKRHAFLFGCNLFVLGQLDTPELNRKYEEAFANLFNFATLPFYWREYEPEEGKPRFGAESAYFWRRPPTDPMVAWCKAHDITPKGHALMYAKTKFMPDWIDPKDPQALKSLATKHMAELAAHYGSDIPIWDVVNEELPRLARPHEWHAVPDDYLAWCFEEAGRLFPKDVKLLINDGVRQSHVTTDEYEALIRGLLDRKVRVEGIGIQFHAGRDSYRPEQMTAVYEQLGGLGLPLYITEITIPGTGEDGPELQGTAVANLYRLWFSTPKMAGITWWNLGDGTAYGNENNRLGGLMDDQMNPKPAYKALDRLINQQWQTCLTVQTDAAGKTGFRGFYGTYTVEITADGRTRTFEINLAPEGPGEHKLTWK